MGTTVFRIRIELIFRRCGNRITPSHQRLSQARRSAFQVLVVVSSIGSRLEKGRSGAHIREMEKYRSRMLEVSVKSDRPPRWEWQVTANGEMIANGLEVGQVEAKFEGYNVMFLLLASGWAP